MRKQLCSSNWMGKVSVLLVEIQFEEFLYKGWFSLQIHSAGRQFSVGGRQFSAGFTLKRALCQKPLFSNGFQALSIHFSPAGHQEPLSTGTFILGVNTINELFAFRLFLYCGSFFRWMVFIATMIVRLLDFKAPVKLGRRRWEQFRLKSHKPCCSH